jgi:hypothetical protein
LWQEDDRFLVKLEAVHFSTYSRQPLALAALVNLSGFGFWV